MEKETIKLKIWGWYIYLSRKRQYLIPHTNGRKTSNLHKMRQLRNSRYSQTKGCCELCGNHYGKENFEMHHILPYKDFPQFARKVWNVMMLCPHCHFVMHKNVVLNSASMQRVAREHGVDLDRECRRAAESRWENRLLKQIPNPIN